MLQVIDVDLAAHRTIACTALCTEVATSVDVVGVLHAGMAVERLRSSIEVVQTTKAVAHLGEGLSVGRPGAGSGMGSLGEMWFLVASPLPHSPFPSQERVGKSFTPCVLSPPNRLRRGLPWMPSNLARCLRGF